MATDMDIDMDLDLGPIEDDAMFENPLVGLPKCLDLDCFSSLISR
jgi:hypothetical protein